MKTITKTYSVYTFDELSEDAKEKAHSNYLRNGYYWSFEEEARATMKEVENLFHITLKNWSIGSYRPEYPDVVFHDDFWYNSWNDPAYELRGNRARAFLWNNFGHVLTSPRYYGKKCLKRSRFVTERVYDGTCPLTGVCFDCDALEPMAYFCFGVEWNEKEQNRTMTKDRTIAHDNRTTVEDVIRDCVHSMFRAFVKDVEDAESRETFKNMCEANEWTFLEDGTMCND